MSRLLLALITLIALPLAPLAPAPCNVVQPEKPPAAQTTCTLQPKFKEARRLIYTFKTKTLIITDTRADPSGPPSAPMGEDFDSELTIRLTALGVDEHGGASFAMFFDKVKINHGVVKSDYTSAEYTREEAEKAEPLPEDAPLEKQLALAIAKVVGRIDVGADGVVTLVEGLEQAQALAKAQGTRGGHLLGPLAPNADRRTLSMLFRIDGAGDASAFPNRKTGDSWELIDRIPLQAVAQLVLTTSLKLESCTADEAHLTGAVRTSVEPALDDDDKPLPKEPGRPTLEVADQTDKLSATWNPKLGVLKKRERESSISFAARLGAARQSAQTMRTHSTIELTEITDP